MNLTALGVAILAGLHTSTWGMYKDAPHEGFTWPKYFRSTVVAALVGVGLQAIGRPPTEGAGAVQHVLRVGRGCRPGRGEVVERVLGVEDARPDSIGGGDGRFHRGTDPNDLVCGACVGDHERQHVAVLDVDADHEAVGVSRKLGGRLA